MTIIDKNTPACAHLSDLQELLDRSGLEIFGEWTQSPDGWVNVHCKQCDRYYRVDLRDTEPEEVLAGTKS
ncbi:MAG TPA: hypothetical protein VFW40_05735 [Capsulimonadaceae bacterium]|nr:hypothetical protein [Capsulimonadaceae bacterium]